MPAREIQTQQAQATKVPREAEKAGRTKRGGREITITTGEGVVIREKPTTMMMMRAPNIPPQAVAIVLPVIKIMARVAACSDEAVETTKIKINAVETVLAGEATHAKNKSREAFLPHEE